MPNYSDEWRIMTASRPAKTGGSTRGTHLTFPSSLSLSFSRADIADAVDGRPSSTAPRGTRPQPGPRSCVPLLPSHSSASRALEPLTSSLVPRAQAPLSAAPILSQRSPTLLRFVPDAEWDAVCQRWDFADAEGMKLPSVPGEDDAVEGEAGTGWEGETLTGRIEKEEKWVKGEC